jgi:microcin C transport system ATP-binding protein
MKNGKVVEEGPSAQIFASPREAYTKALLAAAFDLTVAQRAAVAG